jgi:hypothetical protein
LPSHVICISRSPGTIRGAVSIPVGDKHAAWAAMVARRLGGGSALR